MQERISELTIDEELAAHPDVAKEIDEEISQGNFLPWGGHVGSSDQLSRVP